MQPWSSPSARAFGATVPFATVLVAIVLMAALLPASAAAQQEFTRQRMLVMNFDATERNLGRQVAHQLRGRVRGGSNRRELYVLETWEVDSALTRAGFGWDDQVLFPVIRLLARDRGTDELVVGSIERRDGQYHASARLVLTRDPLLVQPLEDVTGRSSGDVANAFGDQIVDVRRQMVHVRRCENAAREQDLGRAVSLARAGMREMPRATIVRTCLVRVLARRNDPAEVIREGMALLEIDPTNGYALEHVAESHDQLGQRDAAARMWTRLAALAPDSAELVTRVTVALLDGKNAKAAEPVIVHASTVHEGNTSLMRLRWHAHFEADNFEAARVVGEQLIATDELSRNDSTFNVRMVGVYQRTSRPVAALALAAAGVDRFPTDPRFQVLYTELVRSEAPVALDRGLQQFPNSAGLLAIRARDLRREGRVHDALHTTRMAVEADPRLAQGYLQLAHAYTEAEMPDSAYAMLVRALQNGEQPEQVAQYALSRGNALYRQHAASSNEQAMRVALDFLALSDSLVATREAKFLHGAAGSVVVRLSIERANVERACTPAITAAQLLPTTMSKLSEGAELSPDAAAQQLEYLGRLQQVVDVQLDRFCSEDERRSLTRAVEAEP